MFKRIVLSLVGLSVVSMASAQTTSAPITNYSDSTHKVVHSVTTTTTNEGYRRSTVTSTPSGPTVCLNMGPLGVCTATINTQISYTCQLSWTQLVVSNFYDVYYKMTTTGAWIATGSSSGTQTTRTPMYSYYGDTRYYNVSYTTSPCS